VAVPRCLDQLRDATRARHAALDTQLRLESPAAYVRFAIATLAAIETLEPAIAAHVAGFGTDRVVALRADLEELGAAPAPALAHPAFASPSAAFGAAYVMEGSTLGGLVLADRVEALGSTATRYLRLRGSATGARWKHFLAELEARVTDRGACCAAAVATFAHYEAAYRQYGSL